MMASDLLLLPLTGSFDQLVLSRKHYSLSLTMQGPSLNLRALYGLLAACSAIQDEARRRPDEAELRSQLPVTDQLAAWGKQQLQDLAKAGGGDSVRAVSLVL